MNRRACSGCGKDLPPHKKTYCGNACKPETTRAREKAYQRHYYRTVALPKRGGLKRKPKQPLREKSKKEPLSPEKRAQSAERRRAQIAQNTTKWRTSHRDWCLKYARVLRQRKKGNILCFWCEHSIPEEKIKKSGRKHPQPFCSQACATAKKKATGHYQKMSRFGLKRQMEIKAETGIRPGYEGRAAYMRALNEKRKKEKDSTS